MVLARRSCVTAQTSNGLNAHADITCNKRSMARSDEQFDSVDSMPSSNKTDGGGYRRRLTTETLTSLRRRRTGPGRAFHGSRKPLQPSKERVYRDDEDDGSSDSDDDSDDDDEGTSFWEVFCCCWGPRCCVSSCMLLTALVIWSSAITYGILKQPSYEQIVTPVRVARQRWFSKTPHGAEDGFILFDRNADGYITVSDMAVVARVTTGEDPTHEQLVAYIARGDLDGDGKLDEAEYMQMLQRERAVGKGKGAGAAGAGAQGVSMGGQGR